VPVWATHLMAGNQARIVRHEYDGGISYVGGVCGMCTHPFHVAISGRNSVAQSCIDINGCPTCLKLISNTGASRRLSVNQWQLSRHLCYYTIWSMLLLEDFYHFYHF
jgi:hypothetical protein